MAEVKRKKGESFEALLRRFSRRIQQSGRIIQAKKVRFYRGEKNSTATKAAALRRNEITQHRDYLLKTGKLKEERGFAKRGPRG